MTSQQGRLCKTFTNKLNLDEVFKNTWRVEEVYTCKSGWISALNMFANFFFKKIILPCCDVMDFFWISKMADD